MADKTITFGAAEDLGAIAGWEYQGGGTKLNYDRAVALDNTGDEAASAVQNDRTECNPRLVCNNNTNTIPATLGALLNSAYILTGINISTREGQYAEMSLSSHNHADNAHANTLRQAAHGITLAKAKNATDFMGGTAGDNADVIEGSCNITCQHIDQPAGGIHLVGQNYGGKIECRTVWSGVPSATDDGTWDITILEYPDVNTGFVTTVVTGVKALALSDPA